MIEKKIVAYLAAMDWSVPNIRAQNDLSNVSSHWIKFSRFMKWSNTMKCMTRCGSEIWNKWRLPSNMFHLLSDLKWWVLLAYEPLLFSIIQMCVLTNKIAAFSCRWVDPFSKQPLARIISTYFIRKADLLWKPMSGIKMSQICLWVLLICTIKTICSII